MDVNVLKQLEQAVEEIFLGLFKTGNVDVTKKDSIKFELPLYESQTEEQRFLLRHPLKISLREVSRITHLVRSQRHPSTARFFMFWNVA